MQVPSLWVWCLLVFLGTVSGRLPGSECPWGCIPIKQCEVIFRDLVTAKTAREKGQHHVVDKVVGLVRQYICDDLAEQVCCPEYLGNFNNSQTRAAEAVYAVDSGTIVVRSRWEPQAWAGPTAEAFFWRNNQSEQECFHGRTFRPGFNLNLLFDVFPESDIEELEIELPSSMSIKDVSCVSVWEGDTELGAAFLRFPDKDTKDG